MPIESKYFVIAGVLLFLLALWLSRGSLIAGFGVLALTAAIGWIVRSIRPGP
jgi:hypothetical protein